MQAALVVDEDEHQRAVAHIIRRDFFPLSHEKRMNEQNLGRKKRRRKNTGNAASSSSSSSSSDYESLSDVDGGGEEGEGTLENPLRRVSTLGLGLDSFRGGHISEDSASFEAVAAKDRAKHAAKIDLIMDTARREDERLGIVGCATGMGEVGQAQSLLNGHPKRLLKDASNGGTMNSGKERVIGNQTRLGRETGTSGVSAGALAVAHIKGDASERMTHTHEDALIEVERANRQAVASGCGTRAMRQRGELSHWPASHSVAAHMQPTTDFTPPQLLHLEFDRARREAQKASTLGIKRSLEDVSALRHPSVTHKNTRFRRPSAVSSKHPRDAAASANYNDAEANDDVDALFVAMTPEVHAVTRQDHAFLVSCGSGARAMTPILTWGSVAGTPVILSSALTNSPERNVVKISRTDGVQPSLSHLPEREARGHALANAVSTRQRKEQRVRRLAKEQQRRRLVQQLTPMPRFGSSAAGHSTKINSRTPLASPRTAPLY